MLTQNDIDDLKNYSKSFNDFCASHTCDDSCKIFIKSTTLNKSCFRVFVEEQKHSNSQETSTEKS